jgi:Protein of unknown function (DUF998)
MREDIRSRGLVRSLAWLAVAAQPVFVVLWIVGGGLQPHYSAVVQPVSELGALTAHDPWVVNSGLILMGVSLLAVAPGLGALLPRRPATVLAVAMFAVAGIAFVLTGVFRMDCSLTGSAACLARYHHGQLSSHSSVHAWAGLLAQVALLIGPFALARALWLRPVAVLCLIAGLVGIGLGVIGEISYLATGGIKVGSGINGLMERLGLIAANIWLLLVAGGILSMTRRAPAPPPPTPMRPRDFFGRAWSGAGELIPFPWILRGLLSQRFTFTREVTFITDELFVVHDTGRLERGFQMSLRYYCEFLDPSHVHITAAELPDGADLTLDEEGYQLKPFRLAFPVGPLRFTYHVREQPQVASDGTIIDTIVVTYLRVPVARLTAHGRLKDQTPSAPKLRPAAQATPTSRGG